MSRNAQLLTDYLESLYVRWVWTMGPRTNLYIIGGDPLTQLIFLNNFLFEFFFFIRNAVRGWGGGGGVGGGGGGGGGV